MCFSHRASELDLNPLPFMSPLSFLGNKRTKSRFKPKYKITGKGWIVIGVALLLAFIEYSMYVGPFLNTIETIDKRKAYDKECESLI